MDDIIKVNSVFQYNEMLGQETLHPLVSILDFSKSKQMLHARYSFGFFAIFLKDVKCGDLIYGRKYYDYQEGTVVCLAPGQIIGIADNGKKYQPKGKALVFHPDLLRGTVLGQEIKKYTFFSYEVNEALHLSEQERQTVLDCFDKISTELSHSIDKHSKTLIVSNIELLLNYCTRFYERQFITRENVNVDILSKFEGILNKYFDSDEPQSLGIPTVGYCADKLNLSANYLGDLIKRETGKTAQEHIHYLITEHAKNELFDSEKSISEIAYNMGFRYPQHFSRMFKKCVGLTPIEFRSQN